MMVRLVVMNQYFDPTAPNPTSPWDVVLSPEPSAVLLLAAVVVPS